MDLYQLIQLLQPHKKEPTVYYKADSTTIASRKKPTCALQSFKIYVVRDNPYWALFREPTVLTGGVLFE